jgi:hypothetical protein
MAYSNDFSDELLAVSPAAISKYMTSSSHSHSGSTSKLSRHNSDRRTGLSGLKKQSQLSKRASMQFDSHRPKYQGMKTSVSSFNISSSYPKSSTFFLSSSTPPKIEITIDNSLFDDFYTAATTSLSEAADEHSIIRVTPDTCEAEEGPLLPASPTETFQSSGYSIYDDGCTQYSTSTSTITDSSCSSRSCSKSNDLADSFSAASRVHGASCTGFITQNHTTSTTMETAPKVFTGTLWVGGDNCLTQTFITEPVFLAEYDDDDDDLDHLVCYTKLQPRMASFVR